MKAIRTSILLIGDELTTGAIADSNGAFLARHLSEEGFEILRFSVVRDRIEEIAGELQRLTQDSELIISTGGLGPTSDDLTRYAFARAAGVSLRESQTSLEKIKEMYAKRGIPFNAISIRQAEFPETAEIIENTAGTADAFAMKLRNVWAVSLPGVAREVHDMYSSTFGAWLLSHFPREASIAVRYLKFFGRSESSIGTAIEECKLPDALRVAYRPVFPEVWVKISAPVEQESELDHWTGIVRTAVGDEFCFSVLEQDSLGEAVGYLLEESKLTVAAAESCSGGRLSDWIVARPGASNYFAGSVTSYSNEAKEVYLGVSHELLNRCGAVSAEVATQMAYGVKHRLGSDYALSITGIAGPGGGTEEKPVGTVFIGLASPKGVRAFRYTVRLDRERFRRYCAALALDLVRRDIRGLPLEWERK